MNRLRMDLQLFAEGGEAPAAPAASPATGAESSAAGTGVISAGDTLGNGQQVQNAQVAAELNRQIKRHPELRKVYGQRPQSAQPAQQPAQAEAQPDENAIQAEWEELKKGKYKDLYGADVQNAIKDRFKNQANLQQQLDELQPIIDAAKKIYGVDDTAAIREAIQKDDRLAQLEEEEAEAAGMTVDSFRTMKELEEQNARYRQQEQQSIQQQMLRNHFQKLTQQAEELKQIFPGFDLIKEMEENPEFARLTGPNVGVSVKDAFYALHGEQLAAESMKAGMERAQKQLGQTIRAQGMRPIEGAAHGQGQPAAQAPMDFRNMTRQERDKFRSQVKTGKVVIPGG